MSADDRYVPEYPREDAAPRDGIGEEDHPIPAWWWWTFLGTVVFAAFYIPYYGMTEWSQERQYAEEVARIEAQLAATAPKRDANPFTGDAAAIAEGQQVFATICAACHKPDATGLVGPSLVDPYWKYGAADADLFASVAKGRPAGMPAWEAQLGADKIWKALAYLATLPKSDAPGVGAPGVGVGAPAAAPPAAGG
jgi:cytochrome c oxidase cbb3-type subunit 3